MKRAHQDKRVLYIDATSGVSGDMLLGALLDLEIPVEVLHHAWNALGLDNYEVQVFEVQKAGMRALRCRVETEESSGPQSWSEYRAMIARSTLSASLRPQTESLCRKLFEIESSIHGISLERLHLHEMGGTDLLIDVVGTLAAIEHLKPQAIYCSPVNTGRGFLKFSHGTYPVPAPAVTNILVDAPVFQNEVEGELTTPTGALLVKHLASGFGTMPEMTLTRVGVGAGEKEIEGHPNVTRIYSGLRQAAGMERAVYQVESNIDDSNPQLLGHFMEKAFEAGALDVFFQPIFMKKNRPAIRLTMLVEGAMLQELTSLLFAETSAIGLRYWKVEREKLERKWSHVTVRRHKIRIKESYQNGKLLNFQPEYEDCKAAAAALNRPLKQVLAEAIHQYLKEKKQ
jgi:pyridinium-3,5-bisthiocarboxylic acid mononucleotide nickel chelatase